MKIYINKEIIDRFKKEGLGLDYIGTIIIILMCLYERDYKTLDEIDDFNKSKRLLMLYRYLVRKGLIMEPGEDNVENENVHYILSEKGNGIVKFLLSFDVEQLEVSKESFPEILQVEEGQVDEWIVEWINIFPEGKYLGRSLRTNKRDCLDRMRWFLKNYHYTKQQIFEATKDYIESQQNSPNGFQYTRNSTYFIVKGVGREKISDLATECEKLLEKKVNRFDAIDRDSI